MNNSHFDYLKMPSFLHGKHFVFLLITLIISSCRNHEPPPAQILTFDEILSDEIVHLSLKTNLGELFSEGKEEEYQPASITLSDKKEKIFEGNIKVRPRGVTRKKICETPPLKLKLEEGESELELKLVTPCHDGTEYEQLIFKEHLIYKMYNQFSVFSFNVQMVKLRIEDSEGLWPDFEEFAFVIEDNEDLASRLNADIVKPEEELKFIDQNQYCVFTVFQYLIGNTDWNLKEQHNLELFYQKNSKSPLPVPYDFDYSGLVNAPYAVPHPQLPINNVRERYFMWRGKKKDGFDEVVDLFETKKDNLFALIDHCPYLNCESKQEMEEYLGNFYESFELALLEH